MLPLSMELAHQLQSTGSPQELSHQSKTKALAVHVGPFRPPEQWKVPTKSNLVFCSHLLSSNSLIVWKPAKVVMVAGNPVLSHTTKATTPWLKTATHIPQLMVLVLTSKILMYCQPVLLTLLQAQSPTWWMRLLSSQFQFQSKLTSCASRCTSQESWTTQSVAQPLTTLFSPLDMELTMLVETTGSSRTHGAPHGEKMATSESPELLAMVSAASRWVPFTLQFDINS